MSSLLSEINHYRKESVYDNFFRICLPESNIKYEKITRKIKTKASNKIKKKTKKVASKILLIFVQ